MTTVAERTAHVSTFTDLEWEEATPESSSYQSQSLPGRVSDRPIFDPSDPDLGNGDSVVIEVTSRTAARLSKSIEELEKLLSLPPNWDSYGARPIRPSVFLHAVKLLAPILETRVPRPTIVPTTDGGVQLEWHQPNADLEIHIRPDRLVEVYLEMGNGETWEGPLANSRWRLEQFLAYATEQASDRR